MQASHEIKLYNSSVVYFPQIFLHTNILWNTD